MNKVITLLKIVVAVLPFVVSVLSSMKANLNRTKRGRQFVMPLLALIYCIVAAIFITEINAMLHSAIDFISNTIPFIGGAVSSLNIPALMIYVSNAALVAGFIVVKVALLPIVNAIWSNKKVMEHTSELFYEHDEDLGNWFLKKEFANVRGYFKGFFYAALIASSVVFVLSRFYAGSSFFKAEFYPAFVIIVLGEVVFFLSGITSSEFVEDVLGENEESFKVTNYGMLRKIYNSIFGERVLFDNSVDSGNSVNDTYDILDKMVTSDDRYESLVGNYFMKKKENGVKIDSNYIESCANLMKGKSTLFNNPFYKDLTDYIVLPMTKSLISFKKCLVILGRDSALDDVRAWLEDGMTAFNGTGNLWNVGVITSDSNEELDIGILRFSDIYNIGSMKANSAFFSRVGFVLLIEPSRILGSGQLGLNIVVNFCGNSNNITYCACDRNCDGLVDSLSHILKTSITEVTATVASEGVASVAVWEADGEYMHYKLFDNISRYLGIGTEINSVALKYQINGTKWIGGEKFPVNDIKWIDGQYYNSICDYANMPKSQETFSRMFDVSPNLWYCAQEENSFVVVEDEFKNAFETARLFASRGNDQVFVNVISENYLLRDYMIDNARIFSADPKAIPTIVPDYARTERNAVLKLIMLMLYEPVNEERIAKELTLCGLSFDDPYDAFKKLVVKHCFVNDPSLSIRFKDVPDSNGFNTKTIKFYEINETNALYKYASLLKNAYFVSEEEEDESNYIGAKLYGQVFQSYLPGQFVTVDGKYYEVNSVSAQKGVVLRRASDHIECRHYYRQLRTVSIDSWNSDCEMGRKKNISGIGVEFGFADIRVNTSGYLDMTSYGDIKNARKIILNGIPERCYKNKNVLKLTFPGIPRNVLSTICLMLNEVFVTTYPTTHEYVCAIMGNNESLNGELESALYKTEINCDASSDSSILIVEDSEIDLGLIVSVERNISRYLEIISDVLRWQSEKMTPDNSSADDNTISGDEETTEKKPKKDIFKKIADAVKKVFHPKKKEKDDESVTDDDSNSEEVTADAADTVDNETEGLACVSVNPSEAVQEGKENMKVFLKYGFDSIPEPLDINATIAFIGQLGLDKGPLFHIRNNSLQETEDYNPQKFGAHMCDFCGTELLGGEYEVLGDGRERCTRCSNSALRTGEEFHSLYKRTLRNMEVYYGIKINVPITVRMVSARKIAAHFKEKFVPTPGFDSRTVGFAKKDNNGYCIYIENGAPKLSAIGTCVHELTHIWQYMNWKRGDIVKLYGKKHELEIYEGMAEWATVQYMILLGESKYARRLEITDMNRDDVYGRGFALYRGRYMLSHDTSVANTPFKNNPPV